MLVEKKEVKIKTIEFIWHLMTYKNKKNLKPIIYIYLYLLFVHKK